MAPSAHSWKKVVAVRMADQPDLIEESEMKALQMLLTRHLFVVHK